MASEFAFGPLAGVPVAIKDLISTKGIRTAGGARAYADFVPDEDDIVVELEGQQRVLYDLLFVGQLRLVAQILPFTAAADGKMFAKRLHTFRGRRCDALYPAFCKSTFFLLNKYVHHVAGHRAIHKNSEPFRGATHALAPVGNAVNGDIFQYNLLFRHNKVAKVALGEGR